MEPSSGDLMADLHKKLAMRRKGISGTKENQDMKSKDPIAAHDNNLLSSISSMIPAPPSSNRKTDEHSDNDSEWE